MKIDKVKKEIYKKARKEGKSKQDSLKLAGYATTTAEHSQNCTPLAIIGDQEILAERVKHITKDFVLSGLLEEAADLTNKASDRIRAKELLGKYLQLFQETRQQSIAIFNNTNDLENDLKRVVLPKESRQVIDQQSSAVIEQVKD